MLETNRVYCMDIFDLCAALPDASVDMKTASLSVKCDIIKLPSRAVNTEGVSQPSMNRLTMSDYITKTCPVCGKEYLADPKRLKHGRQTTCSRECSYTLRAQNKKISVTITCPNCGKAFSRRPSTVKYSSAYCSSNCYDAHRAKEAGYKGALQYRFCLVCGKQFKRQRRSVYCSRQCFETAHVDNMKGRKNPSYVDGRSYSKTYDAGSRWREIRLEVYKRDHYTCQHCGVKCVSKSMAMKYPEYSARIIQCHHIAPYEASRNNEMSNLITLCLRCHRKVHNAAA